MKNNFTDITVILDRSGSMSSVANDVIGGFNKFIESQKKVKGTALMSLVQFDNEYESVYEGIDIKEVKELNLVPRGMTALLDAIGRSITETGERLNNMKKNKRPDKVICVIITDGEENASKEYNKQQISEMIKHQTSIYNWEFVFLGANQDAINEANSIGINMKNAINYSHSSKGYANTFNILSSTIASCRSCGNDISFSDKDREKAMEE